MTSAAIALPDAAVRMLRAVAGRRALQVVLLLAGLLALGFLCGERAHAVEGVPAPERVESARTAGSVQPARERAAEPVRESVREGREAVRFGRRAVRDVAVEPVADAVEPVVRDARGAVRPVVDGVPGVLEDAPQRVLPEAPDLPDLPGLPGTPDVPGMPSMPELPQSGLGQGVGGGDDAGAGAGPAAPRAGRGEATARAHDAGAESTYGTGTGAAAGIGSAHAAGQQARSDALFCGGSADCAHRAGNAPFPTPLVPLAPLAPPSPPGDPARTLGGQFAGDGSSTRHGDPCTASYGSRASVRLLHGAGAVPASAPVRERHRDILEFPG
ncbi:hypothetical protein GCM10010277_59890 [Streptomyces longisporoflavus]|nr:hypothetical protein GCM10010277_59890 [Streptomyces longisporoflavus]